MGVRWVTHGCQMGVRWVRSHQIGDIKSHRVQQLHKIRMLHLHQPPHCLQRIVDPLRGSTKGQHHSLIYFWTCLHGSQPEVFSSTQEGWRQQMQYKRMEKPESALLRGGPSLSDDRQMNVRKPSDGHLAVRRTSDGRQIGVSQTRVRQGTSLYVIPRRHHRCRLAHQQQHACQAIHPLHIPHLRCLYRKCQKHPPECCCTVGWLSESRVGGECTE